MKVFGYAWSWLADEPHQRSGTRILQAVMGFMLLYRVFTEARFAAYFWGPTGLGSGSSTPLLGGLLGRFVDRIFETQAGPAALLVVLGIAALALVLGYKTRLATGFALFVFILLGERFQDLPDGGDNIALLVLCYMLFLIPAGAARARGCLSVWIHNIAVLAIASQIIVVYSTAGLAKAYGNLWYHGTAMYYVSQVHWFSLPTVCNMFKSAVITTIASYASVLYELWFPVAVLSPLRRLWIATGILFHLGIAIFMGLITFSMMMIALDLFFISDREYIWIGEVTRRVRSLLLERLKSSFLLSPYQDFSGCTAQPLQSNEEPTHIL
jgi:hypothetical protein